MIIYRPDPYIENLTGDFSFDSIGVNLFGGDLGLTDFRMGSGIATHFNNTAGFGVGIESSFNGTSKLTADNNPYSWEN